MVSCVDQPYKKVKNSLDISTIKLPQKKTMDIKYLMNPPSSDSLCFFSVERAKKDLKKHKGVYVQTICYGCNSIPYQAEIEVVLKSKGFKLGIEELGCVDYEGHTRGCYKDYINLKMKEKYGENYISEIENEAQKLFIKNINQNNAVINVFDLKKEEMPQSLDKKVYFENDYYLTLKTNLPIKQSLKKYIFLYLDFIVEKNGTLTQFEVSYYHSSFKDKELKQKLINFAIQTIQEKYNNWNPGNYKGNIARTKVPLRVSFF